MTASPSVGLPSEEDVARIVCRRVHEALYPDAEVWRPGELDRRVDQYWPHYVPEAQRILCLIRPAFEAKDAEIEGWKTRATVFKRLMTDAQRDKAAAEAKLAQAVEALAAVEPYVDAIVCYASTINEHDGNRVAQLVRTASAAARGET